MAHEALEPPTMPQPFYSVDQLAYVLNVSAKTVRSLIKNGELRAVKVGDLVRVNRDEFERWLQEKSLE